MLRARATDLLTTFSPFAIGGRAPSPRALTRLRCGGDELVTGRTRGPDGDKKRGQRGGRKEYKAHKAGQRKQNDKYGDKAT